MGNLSARVRERLWQIVVETMGTGGIMVFRARNEQGLSFLTWGDPWVPTDFEGLTLMVRPGVCLTTLRTLLRQARRSVGEV